MARTAVGGAILAVVAFLLILFGQALIWAVAVGMFLLVFGIQEGETYNWGTIIGPVSVWSLIIAGLVVLAGFVVWQRYNKGEPLLPLGLFRDRNFSLANLGITMVGFTVTAFGLPDGLPLSLVMVGGERVPPDALASLRTVLAKKFAFVGAGTPYQNMQQLLDAMKAKPGEIKVATAGSKTTFAAVAKTHNIFQMVFQ